MQKFNVVRAVTGKRVFLTAVLLTGCLSSGGNTVSVKCVTGLDVTQSNYGLSQQLRMDFDKKTGVLTAEAEVLRAEYAFNGKGELLSMYRYYTYAESWSSYVLTYDEAGKLICEEYSASGSEGSKKEYLRYPYLLHISAILLLLFNNLKGLVNFI